MSIELSADQLHRVCDPHVFGCDSSAEIKIQYGIIGQERAVRALRFGLGIKRRGFNIFVAGESGTGRITAVQRFLEEVAINDPLPSDWCYVYNFRDSFSPQALRFPAGAAVGFQSDMDSLIQGIVKEIRTSFESEEYAVQKDATIKAFEQKKGEMLEGLNQQALQFDFTLQATPVGLASIPLIKGKPIDQEEFMGLPDDQKKAIIEKQSQLQPIIESTLRQVRGLDKTAGEALQKLDQQVGSYAIDHLFQDMKQKYHQLGDVEAYLDEVREDIIKNLARLKPAGEEQTPALPQMGMEVEPLTQKYKVNVMVNNTGLKGAPVVIERNPNFNNLIGRIEQEARFGALVTDFTLIRKGSLHRANGGYLVLPVEEVLRNPLAWESLKRALENREIVIEDASEKLGFFSTKSLRPEPIPLDIKVILIGRPEVYELLLANDEQFKELFKVKADFDTRMGWTEQNIHDYAEFVSTICSQENLKHLDCSALARIVEYGSRLAEDQEKLSTRFGEIADIVREASYYADQEHVPFVTSAYLQKAIEERVYRSSMFQKKIQENIQRGKIKIEVSGARVGEVNGLSVLELGDFAFGQPNRITVSLGPGHGSVVDIEREVHLGGPIHSKGVMILSGFLMDTFGQDKPLSMDARIVFEQSYSGIEGDSASSTELYAILSGLSGLPVQQGIGVTGSVNQRGEVQAIGGVNEKIEGFFEICSMLGLSAEQGVIIPQSNTSNLMLNEKVVEAVKAGQFHIWPVSTIAEGIEILTGVPAGNVKENGKFQDNTVFGRVDHRIREFAETLEEAGRKEEAGEKKPVEGEEPKVSE
jgi:lon-related putative ATP-dependent protease